jgi:hypothetical protein
VERDLEIRDLEIRDLEKVRDLERDLEMVTVLGLSVTTAVRKDIMQMFAGIHRMEEVVIPMSILL